MKTKQLIIAILSVTSVQSFAQLNKAKWMVNGMGNYYTGSTENHRDGSNSAYTSETMEISNGGLNLNTGYFISNSFALGLSGGFGKAINNSTATYVNHDANQSELVRNNYSVGIFGRYNHSFGERKFGMRLQLDNRFTWGNSQEKIIYQYAGAYSDETVNYNISHGYTCSLTPGIFYFVTNRLSLELNFGTISYFANTVKTSTGGGAPIDKRSDLMLIFLPVLILQG